MVKAGSSLMVCETQDTYFSDLNGQARFEQHKEVISRQKAPDELYFRSFKSKEDMKQAFIAKYIQLLENRTEGVDHNGGGEG